MKHKYMSLGADIIIESGFNIKNQNFCNQLYIGNNVYFGENTKIEVGPQGLIEIGNKVWFTGFTFICANFSISIGDDCLIGEFCSIRDFDHKIDERSINMNKSGCNSKPIKIGKNVWIGRGVAILKGVTIGDGAVIGANAVVTHDIDAYEVVVGIPAKHLKYR